MSFLKTDRRKWIKKQIKKAMSILFLRRQPRPVRLLVLLGIALLAMSIFVDEYSQFLNPVEVSEARGVLIATAEILTTILAISVSLLLVGIQSISEAYSTRALRAYFSDVVFIGYLVTYASAIFLVWGTLTFNVLPINMTPVLAYFVLVFCVAYLLVILFHLPRTVHPVNIINRLTKNIRKDFCQTLVKAGRGGPFVLGPDDEPFFALERILLRSVAENDFPSFLAGNQYLESLLAKFLAATNDDIRAAKDTKQDRETPAGVFRYFLRIYRNIVTEAILHGRELHLTHVCESLKRFLTTLHEIKSFWAFEQVSELYEYSGMQALDKRLLSFLSQYAYQGLKDLTEAQTRILNEPVFPFEGLGQTLSKEEQEIRTLNDILYNRFRERLDFISEFAEKAAELGLEMIVSACMSIYSDVLNKTLQLEPIVRRRGVLKTCVMPSLVNAHKKCVDKGDNSTTFTTHMLHYLIERMKKEEIGEFGAYVTSAYAEMSRYSIEKGFYGSEILAWGVNGRFLVKDHPDLIAYVIDVLVGALEILKDKTDPESKEYYVQAWKDLESLKSWERHGHEEVSKRVEQELAKYPPIAAV